MAFHTTTIYTFYHTIKGLFIAILSLILAPFYLVILLIYLLKWYLFKSDPSPLSRKDLAEEYRKLARKMYASIEAELRLTQKELNNPPPSPSPNQNDK